MFNNKFQGQMEGIVLYEMVSSKNQFPNPIHFILPSNDIHGLVTTYAFRDWHKYIPQNISIHTITHCSTFHAIYDNTGCTVTHYRYTGICKHCNWPQILAMAHVQQTNSNHIQWRTANNLTSLCSNGAFCVKIFGLSSTRIQAWQLPWQPSHYPNWRLSIAF